MAFLIRDLTSGEVVQSVFVAESCKVVENDINVDYP